jgi:2-phosphosulfolactate phosphatase
MEINIYRRKDCANAHGLCIVIDVLRAFTTAAFAFASGAKEIILVSSIEDALDLYRADHSLILMGEQGGMPIQGFHYGNSPAEISNAMLTGCTIVQRTSAGTQGVVACGHASEMMIASFVVAEATLRYITASSSSHVSFIVTGDHNGDEDLALAEYLRERLLQKTPSVSSFLNRVKNSPEGQVFADPSVSEFPVQDLELALQVDRFPFAMEVKKKNGLLVASKVGRIENE